MNPIVIRLAASIACALAVFFALQVVPGIAGEQAQIASFAVIFIGIAVAVFSTAGGSAAAGSAGGTTAETGTVKWFNVKKGYGFITRDSGDDVFVHYRNITNSGSSRRGIADGQRVKFIVVDGDKGLQADEVEAI